MRMASQQRVELRNLTEYAGNNFSSFALFSRETRMGKGNEKKLLGLIRRNVFHIKRL